MVFVEILSFGSRWGQVEVLQRQPNLSDRMLSTSFWLLTAGGLAITLIIAAGAQVITFALPGQALFGWVLLMLAPIVGLRAWNAVPEAILKRRFDYRSLAARTWVATLLGGFCGGYLAYRGLGIYSLIAQRLVTAVIGTITSWTVLKWHPRLSFDRTEAGYLVRTGADVMGAGFASVLNQRIAEGMTGFGLGAAQLGLLRLTGRLFDFIAQGTVQPVSNVALSTFSQLQHDREAMKRAYLRLTQFMVLGSLPMYFGLGAVADVFVPLVLGTKWAGAIIVIQLMSFSRIAAPVNYFFGPAMIAVGKTRVVLRQAIVQVFMTIVLIAIGSFFGLVGVLVAITARAIIVAAYNVYALRKEIGLETLAVLGVLVPPTAACGAMVVAVEVAKRAFAGSFAPVWMLIFLVAIGGVTYGASLLLGDIIGLWRGYLRGAAGSLAGALGRRSLSPTAAPA